MNNLLKNIRARVSGYPSYLLREDIKSIFSQRNTTSLGFFWYFFGVKKLNIIIHNRYYDKEKACYDIEGVRIPEIVRTTSGPMFNSYLFNMLETYFGYFQNHSSRTARSIYGEGPYECGNVWLESGDVVIDAGANMGVFSALASKKCCSDNEEGAVYAFEPVPQNIDILKITADLNNAITIVPEGLSDSIGTIDIYLQQSSGEHTILSDLSKNADSEKIEIQTTTLDRFAHERNLKKIDFIKADIEGAERLMLMGAKNVLRDYSPKLALCTYHLPDDPQVMQEIILDANPNYIIEQAEMKMFAYVPK